MVSGMHECVRKGFRTDIMVDRTALYEDVVSNNTLAEQYRQYMLRHLGLTPEQMPTLAESRIAHDQPGCS